MNHLSQIADKLSQYDLDAMLIVSEPGERYAVGFQGEGYVLVISGGGLCPGDPGGEPVFHRRTVH